MQMYWYLSLFDGAVPFVVTVIVVVVVTTAIGDLPATIEDNAD